MQINDHYFKHENIINVTHKLCSCNEKECIMSSYLLPENYAVLQAYLHD